MIDKTTIVLASYNRGKLVELQALLPDAFLLRPQSEFDVPAADESGTTFAANALLKARNASRHTGLPAVADDSGLEVDALGGRPGVYSARYAGPGASDRENVDKLLGQLRGIPPAGRTARFRCAIAFVRAPEDAEPLLCEGVWEGWIQTGPSGDNGFGYDPVFHVPTHGCSAAELGADVKNKLSHRGQALTGLIDLMRGHAGMAGSN